MRYLAILLLTPWLLILAWAYLAYPKRLARTPWRHAFDVLAVLLAGSVAGYGMLLGFDSAPVPPAGDFGPVSGAIWRQVLPVLCGYGLFVALLACALALRQWLFGRR